MAGLPVPDASSAGAQKRLHGSGTETLEQARPRHPAVRPDIIHGHMPAGLGRLLVMPH